MDYADLHPWDVPPKEAIVIQRGLAGRVLRKGAPSEVRRIAGADIAVGRGSRRARGAVVVLSYPELEVIETTVVEANLGFPYVPGLLSFREAPVLRKAFRRLSGPIDLLLVDGQGYAHPRRFGLACHLGLLLDVPAIGVAKSRLLGDHDEPGIEVGHRAELTDGGETVGAVLRARTNVKPLYVSVGHRIGLDEAVDWVLRCGRGYRLPEPTRLADRAAAGRLEAKAGVS